MMNKDDLNWRKASASSASEGCVELAPLEDGGMAVRDSKDPSGRVLSFTAHEWECFRDGMAKGEFDNL